jgi:hypothetical protein
MPYYPEETTSQAMLDKVEPDPKFACSCGQDALVLACEQCGVAVCDPCASARGGFCAEHPDAAYLPYESVEDW